jgi:hypothetical protein
MFFLKTPKAVFLMSYKNVLFFELVFLKLVLFEPSKLSELGAFSCTPILKFVYPPNKKRIWHILHSFVNLRFQLK